MIAAYFWREYLFVLKGLSVEIRRKALIWNGPDLGLSATATESPNERPGPGGWVGINLG